MRNSTAGGHANAASASLKEEQIEIVLKQKRRAENVFAESIDVAHATFQKRVIPKSMQSKAIISAYGSVVWLPCAMYV
jgi:hypothetical protein